MLLRLVVGVFLKLLPSCHQRLFILIEKFPAQATWSVDADSSLLLVDWKKYGKYAFDVDVEESKGIIWPL